MSTKKIKIITKELPIQGNQNRRGIRKMRKNNKNNKNNQVTKQIENIKISTRQGYESMMK